MTMLRVVIRFDYATSALKENETYSEGRLSVSFGSKGIKAYIRLATCKAAPQCRPILMYDDKILVKMTLTPELRRNR